MSNKITEISEQIKALKDITFGEIFTQQLKASKIPFPEKFEHYIEQLIENAQFTQNSKLKVLSADKQSDGWHIDLMGQPFSYIELDNEHYNFPASGRMNIVTPLKESEPFFVAKYTWLPYDESFETNYTKPQNDQYFNSIINSVSFPEKQNKGTIEFGYLIYSNDKDQLLFIFHNIYVRGSLENNYSIDGLLPDFTYTIGNKEFTSDSSGTINFTTKEAFEIINAYNEQKDVLSVTGKYNGVLKDHIVKEKDIVFQSSPNFLELDVFKPSDSSNSTYYNRTNVPLEVEYLGETSTIPVDGSKEFNMTFNTVEQLKTIKANATDKIKIKNAFNYPWHKEFTVSNLTSVLDKDLFVNYIKNSQSLNISIEALGKTYNNTNDSSLYQFNNGNNINPTKEYLESIPADATELGFTIKDTFDYPWKTFIKSDRITQTILDKDYFIHNSNSNISCNFCGHEYSTINSAFNDLNIIKNNISIANSLSGLAFSDLSFDNLNIKVNIDNKYNWTTEINNNFTVKKIDNFFADSNINNYNTVSNAKLITTIDKKIDPNFNKIVFLIQKNNNIEICCFKFDNINDFEKLNSISLYKKTDNYYYVVCDIKTSSEEHFLSSYYDGQGNIQNSTGGTYIRQNSIDENTKMILIYKTV